MVDCVDGGSGWNHGFLTYVYMLADACQVTGILTTIWQRIMRKDNFDGLTYLSSNLGLISSLHDHFMGTTSALIQLPLYMMLNGLKR